MERELLRCKREIMGTNKVEDLEREAIREVMSLLGSRRSKRKTEAARRNAKTRWKKEAEKRDKSVKPSE
jgi:hypothetical protein